MENCFLWNRQWYLKSCLEKGAAHLVNYLEYYLENCQDTQKGYSRGIHLENWAEHYPHMDFLHQGNIQELAGDYRKKIRRIENQKAPIVIFISGKKSNKFIPRRENLIPDSTTSHRRLSTTTIASKRSSMEKHQFKSIKTCCTEQQKIKISKKMNRKFNEESKFKENKNQNFKKMRMRRKQ